jgi:hypothetical protein
MEKRLKPGRWPAFALAVLLAVFAGGASLFPRDRLAYVFCGFAYAVALMAVAGELRRRRKKTAEK